jgi:small subunit ribosomal protein S2
MARSSRNGASADAKPEPGVASDEPLAEWEKELLAGSETAAADATEAEAATEAATEQATASS